MEVGIYILLEEDVAGSIGIWRWLVGRHTVSPGATERKVGNEEVGLRRERAERCLVKGKGPCLWHSFIVYIRRSIGMWAVSCDLAAKRAELDIQTDYANAVFHNTCTIAMQLPARAKQNLADSFSLCTEDRFVTL